MSWQNNQGPWSNKPGPSSQLDDLVRQLRDQFGKMLPSGGRDGVGVIIVVAIIAIALWLASGFYQVKPDQQGVVLRFGKWVETTQPGLNYHLPYPIETVVTPQVTRINRVDIGFHPTGNSTTSDSLMAINNSGDNNEGLMLTGDENIVDIDFSVFWMIKDVGKYLFNIQDPAITVREVAESAMREIIGHTPIQVAQTDGRAGIASDTQKLIQSVLDYYGSGVEITQIQLLKVDPPQAVIDAYRDVQAARADLERQRNEAETYANDIIPRARGEASQIVQQAEAYKQQVVADAQGQSARFKSVLFEYQRAPAITKQRMYIEVMQDILKVANKIILNKDIAKSVLPYLPLSNMPATNNLLNNNDGKVKQ